ncbi:MAG: transglutaminaseTgpA domain-containing protein, partial [Actinomycetota bacterium]
PARRAARATGARGIAIVAVLGLLASSAVFLAMPRVRATQIVAPPFSLTNAVPVPEFSGAVVNPGLPDDGASVASSFLPDAYPGFGAGLDLRARGRLSQQIVMKVRSPQAAFWRAQAYDNFDGTTWTATNDTINEIATGNPTILPTDPLETPPVPSKEMLQTFYVEKQQPNVIFAAARPSQLYFPASTIATDGYSSMRAPILLEEGVIYSVVSDVPEVTPAMLRGSNTAELPSEFPQQYLQVPEEMPARVSRLAHQITDGEQTAYDKVLAVQRWLKENTEYKLDIPRDPPGVDAVDYFLFERRQGFCEHIASSMVMLLRAAGIPARLAVGFDSGERNAFTGYFEVRQADAHSWVEVYYPRFGWIEYDPTHAVPLADPGVGNAFVAPQVLRAIGRFIARVIPEPVKAVARSAWSSVASAAKWTARTWPVMVVAVLLVAAGFLALRRYLRRSRRGPPPTGAAAAFVSMCDTFAARGRPRREFQTPSEHVSRLLGEDWVARNAHNDMLRIVRTFERERFAPAKPDPREIQEAIEAAGRLKAQAAHAPGRRR